MFGKKIFGNPNLTFKKFDSKKMVFMDLKKKKKSFETKIHGFIFFINLFWVEHLNLEKGNFKGEEF